MSGLADVIACESSICSIENGVLAYRSYSIDDLAGKCQLRGSHLLIVVWTSTQSSGAKGLEARPPGECRPPPTDL